MNAKSKRYAVKIKFTVKRWNFFRTMRISSLVTQMKSVKKLWQTWKYMSVDFNKLVVDFNKLVVDFKIKYWRYARRLMYTYN